METTNNNEKEFFKNAKVPFEKSKEDIWKDMEAKIDAKPQGGKVIKMGSPKFAIAAAVALIIASVAFMKLYTVNVVTNPGEHMAHILPDGSKVTMNAATELSYAPYWWTFDRSLDMEGEAYFEVAKGSKFSVNSQNGITQVLGTSFNISTRDGKYKVLCTTGKVKVKSPRKSYEVALLPNDYAEIDEAGEIATSKVEDSKGLLAWMRDEFSFDGVNLTAVFKEIERQYNVHVLNEVDNVKDLIYTGHFTKTEEVDSTLDLISETFGLTFVKLDEKSFKVIQR